MRIWEVIAHVQGPSDGNELGENDCDTNGEYCQFDLVECPMLLDEYSLSEYEFGYRGLQAPSTWNLQVTITLIPSTKSP